MNNQFACAIAHLMAIGVYHPIAVIYRLVTIEVIECLVMYMSLHFLLVDTGDDAALVDVLSGAQVCAFGGNGEEDE